MYKLLFMFSLFSEARRRGMRVMSQGRRPAEDGMIARDREKTTFSGQRAVSAGMVAVGAVLLLASTPTHASLVLTYDISPSPYSGSAYIAASSNGLFITDTYDFYDEQRWKILDAQETQSGRIAAQIERAGTIGFTDFEVFGIDFQIMSDDGTDPPASVLVDAWGAVQLNYDLAVQDPVTVVCCRSSVVFDALSQNLTASYPGGGTMSGTASDSFFGTYALQTDTAYWLSYASMLYIEAGSGTEYFDSWDDYYAFIDTYGYSGVTYHKLKGFFQFGMVLHSVPEPGTLALLGLGLVGMGYARRRKAA